MQTKRALSPAEILEASRKTVKQLGLATVYRTLKMLEDNGEILAVNIPGQAPRFERSGKGHHHHFTCKHCGQVFHLDCPGKHETFSLPKGFRLEHQEVLLFGRCDKCNKNKRAA